MGGSYGGCEARRVLSSFGDDQIEKCALIPREIVHTFAGERWEEIEWFVKALFRW